MHGGIVTQHWMDVLQNQKAVYSRQVTHRSRITSLTESLAKDDGLLDVRECFEGVSTGGRLTSATRRVHTDIYPV